MGEAPSCEREMTRKVFQSQLPFQVVLGLPSLPTPICHSPRPLRKGDGAMFYFPGGNAVSVDGVELDFVCVRTRAGNSYWRGGRFVLVGCMPDAGKKKVNKLLPQAWKMQSDTKMDGGKES